MILKLRGLTTAITLALLSQAVNILFDSTRTVWQFVVYRWRQRFGYYGRLVCCVRFANALT